MNSKPNQSANLRADAARVLLQILEEGKSARECLPAMQAMHSDKDKAWLQEMVYGVLRHLPMLQFFLRNMLDKPLKNRFKVVEHLIMLGFYQLAHTRVSQHAAVAETVAACQVLNVEAMKGLVNAVLRSFIRDEVANTPAPNAQMASGLPKWLYKKLATAYPNNLLPLTEQIQQKAPIWLRVNLTKINLENFTQALVEAKVEFELSAMHPQGVILAKGCDITRLPGFDQGWFAVQDGAAQLAAQYLQAQPNDRVLDCCAAPGGKTCHIIELEPKLASVTALEIDGNRAARIDENFTRLGHQGKIIVGNAAHPDNWWDGQQYDRILLDAPCSATGIIRRHPDVKWLRKSKDIDELVTLQASIIDAIWPLLKPGGSLLYATCSILPEENHQQVTGFLLRTENAELDLDFQQEQQALPGQQILPGDQQMDGFYYARLIKSFE